GRLSAPVQPTLRSACRPAGISLPADGLAVGSGQRAVYQGVATSCQGQHGAIPRTVIATLPQYGADQLRRSPGGGARTPGWPSASTASGTDPDSPGSASSSRRSAGPGRRGSSGGGTSRSRPDRLESTATSQNPGNSRAPGWRFYLV
ncbi:MAG: hypothetical protein QQN46_08945, partial [Nitrosopumilus sp.]